ARTLAFQERDRRLASPVTLWAVFRWGHGASVAPSVSPTLHITDLSPGATQSARSWHHSFRILPSSLESALLIAGRRIWTYHRKKSWTEEAPQMKPILGKIESPVYALMRVVVGGLFACHGAQKLFGAFGGHSMIHNPMMLAAAVIEFG